MNNVREIVSLINNSGKYYGDFRACSEVRNEMNQADVYGELGFYLNYANIHTEEEKQAFLEILKSCSFSPCLSIDAIYLNNPEVMEAIKNSDTIREIRIINEGYKITRDVFNQFRNKNIAIVCDEASEDLEEEIRKMISNSLNRGKVDVFINLKNYNDGSGIPKVDINLAQGYLNCLKEIEAKLGVKNDISVMQIARFPEVVTIVEEEDKIEVVWQELKPLISDSLEMMTKMREVEGDKLKEDILSKISIIEQLVLKVEEFADTIPKAFKLKLEERVKELLGNIDIDENRIAMEVCMLADKATVDEEIIRLRSHISQVRETLNLKEPVGRKLDFIVQEMNRETNTIGSKSSDIQMTNIVIDIKNILEKIREQVQNIE